MGRRLSIGRLFAHFAAAKPDEPALVAGDGSGQITWAGLDRHTNRLARAYAAAGVGKDDMVAVALPNSVEFFCACIAAWKLGATAMPLSHKFPPAERRRVLDLARPALLVGSDERYDDLATLPAGFVPGEDLDDGELPEVVPTYWKALTSGGSTGKPKLIVSHDDPHYDPDSPASEYMHADGVHLVCGPLYHNAAFVYSARGLFSGNRLVIMPRFDPALALDLIEKHRVTWLQMVPTHMNRLRRLPPERLARADMSSVRTLLHVGGPCPPRLKLEYIEWLGPDRIAEVYAGTESQGITYITGREWLDHRGSVGRPIRGTRFQVQDEQGRVVPPGVVGEIFLMPPGGQGSTYHYVGAEPRSRDGWESLGDLGWYDEDGYLYLADRSTDCIVSGGANIYPAEVEGALEAHPGVHACAVVGLPDDDLGHRAVALVEPVPGEPAPRADELDEHLRPLLAPYKRPRAYEFVDRPLRDEAGKVRRSALRAERLPGRPGHGRLVMPSRDRWRDLRTGFSVVDRLLRVLDLDQVGERTFEGLSNERPAHRVFGGQVLAQASVAAARTAPDDVVLHSLHGYFARTGDPGAPIRYEVTPLRSGRSFVLQRVDAWQGQEIIATVTCSMQRDEPDHLAHQVDAPPTPPPPEDGPSRFPFVDGGRGEDGTPPGPVEIYDPGRDSDASAPSEVWMRVPAGLPDDPLLHRTLVVYLSDFTVMRAAFRRHGVPRRELASASLDHAVWLHRPGRADRWLRYVTTSPSAGSARALGHGSLFTEDGRLVASGAQEMVIRLRSRLGQSPTDQSRTGESHTGTSDSEQSPAERTGESAHA